LKHTDIYCKLEMKKIRKEQIDEICYVSRQYGFIVYCLKNPPLLYIVFLLLKI